MEPDTHHSGIRQTLDEWLTWIETLHSEGIALGLGRSRQVYARLLANGLIYGEPFLVTIAGTNGKGTTLKLLENAAAASGLRVGSYTSPHLFRFNERVRINGQDVTDEQLILAFEAVESHRQGVSLTYYEFTTLAAFIVMAESTLDIWLLEVGLGGRLDTVNLLDAHLAVVTSIALDHQLYLGDTRELIAAEKIAIARPGTQAFIGGEDLPDAIASFCNENQIKCFDHSTRKIEVLDKTGQWQLACPSIADFQPLTNLPKPKIPLLNAALGMQIWHCIAKAMDFSPWEKINPSALLQQTTLYGRFSLISETPEIWLDAAHNPAAAIWLSEALQALPARPTTAVCAIMADKDIKGVVSPMISLIDHWFLWSLDVERALPAQQLELVLRSLGVARERITLMQTGTDHPALDADHRYLVFGSFYTLEAFVRWRDVERNANNAPSDDT